MYAKRLNGRVKTTSLFKEIDFICSDIENSKIIHNSIQLLRLYDALDRLEAMFHDTRAYTEALQSAADVVVASWQDLLDGRGLTACTWEAEENRIQHDEHVDTLARLLDNRAANNE